MILAVETTIIVVIKRLPGSTRVFVLWSSTSVTSSGDLLRFGQLFKACGNNYFAQIIHIFRQFL